MRLTVCNKASFCVMNKLCCRSWSNTCNLLRNENPVRSCCVCVIWNSIFKFLFSLKMSETRVDSVVPTNLRDTQNDVRLWFRNVGAIVNFEHWAIFIAPFIQSSPHLAGIWVSCTIPYVSWSYILIYRFIESSVELLLILF